MAAKTVAGDICTRKQRLGKKNADSNKQNVKI